MRGDHTLITRKKLLHQAMAAWVILPISALLFAIIALSISSFVKNQTLVVITAFILVAPVVTGVYITLYKRGYYDLSTMRQTPQGKSQINQPVRINRELNIISAMVAPIVFILVI